jgi:hypothetical protein
VTFAPMLVRKAKGLGSLLKPKALKAFMAPSMYCEGKEIDNKKGHNKDLKREVFRKLPMIFLRTSMMKTQKRK